MSGLEELYPFLGGGHADRERLRAEVRQSSLDKSRDIAALRTRTYEANAEALEHAAKLLADTFRAGRKVLAFGNGGSATDAGDFADDLTLPPIAGWRALPAIDLTRDTAMMTAVGNDVGFDKIFVRQLIAYGEPGDIAVGFSTSGESANVIAAFEEARRRGMAKIGFAGGSGGRMAAPGLVDALIVVPSTYIPRIQEAHAMAYHLLLHFVQALLREEAP